MTLFLSALLALSMTAEPSTAEPSTAELSTAETLTADSLYTHDSALEADLERIIEEAGLAGDFLTSTEVIEQVSFAVIDLTDGRRDFAGVNPDNFIYPASVYKMYVAAAVLAQVEAGEYELTSHLQTRAPNIVDRRREVLTDPRPLLADGDTVTVGYLIDLMITRSDNSASNVMIDLAQRPRIDSMMHGYGWQGSEVTRKFLPRQFEDPGYAEIRGTETNARHAAEFLLRMHDRTLVSPWVSMQLETYMGRQLDVSKLRAGLPRSAMVYHKSGWWSTWTNDVSLVDDGDVRYVVALFTPVHEDKAKPMIARVAADVHALIRQRNGR
jgi:beta-lactamase class A